MAYKSQRNADSMAAAAVAANNRRQLDAVASFFHADTTQRQTGRYDSPVVADDLVSAANGTDDATNSVLANDIKAVVNRHFVDDYAHDTALSAVITTADGTDTATNFALANAIKAAYNTHASASGVHFNNDGTNTVTNADGTNAATTATLLNEIKGDVNAHVVSAPFGAMIRLIP